MANSLITHVCKHPQKTIGLSGWRKYKVERQKPTSSSSNTQKFLVTPETALETANRVDLCHLIIPDVWVLLQ